MRSASGDQEQHEPPESDAPAEQTPVAGSTSSMADAAAMSAAADPGGVGTPGRASGAFLNRGRLTTMIVSWGLLGGQAARVWRRRSWSWLQ
jgi:hypothetical protein